MFDGMFEGIDAIPWSEVKHCYGSAEEVPKWLWQVASGNVEVQNEGIRPIYWSLIHQQTVYPVTAYVIPYLLELLRLPTVQVKGTILGFLADVAFCWPTENAEEWFTYPNDQDPWLPADMPFKDAREEIRKGTPIYSDLLADPSAGIRVAAAEVLILVAEPSEQLCLRLLRALQRETEREARANLILALGTFSRAVPEHWRPLLEIVEAKEDDLLAFCAAQMLPRLTRNETPQTVIQLLADVVLHPESFNLDVYNDLPCTLQLYDSVPTWRAAAIALLHIEPAPLHFMGSAICEAFLNKDEGWLDDCPETTEQPGQEPIDECFFLLSSFYDPLRLYTLIELILHIFFTKVAQDSDKRFWAADELTEQQRAILFLLCTRSDPWGSCAEMLKAYGLPYSWKMMTIFLGREDLPSPFPFKPWPWEKKQFSFGPSQSPIKSEIEKKEELDEELGILLHNYLPLPISERIVSSEPKQLFENRECFEEETYYRPERRPRTLAVYSEYNSRSGGRPFTKERLECIDDQALIDVLALEIGSFLHALHHIPPSVVADFDFPLRHSREAYSTLYARAREVLFPTMSGEERKQVTTSFEAFLEKPDNFSLEPVIIHGCFGPSTIFYHPRRHAICHIGGLGSFTQRYPYIGLGDPARDFATMLGSGGYGEEFVRRCEPAYPELASLWERIPFHIQALRVQEALKKKEVLNTRKKMVIKFSQNKKQF